MTRRATVLVTAAALLVQVAGTTWPFVVAVLAPVLIVELGLSATLREDPIEVSPRPRSPSPEVTVG